MPDITPTTPVTPTVGQPVQSAQSQKMTAMQIRQKALEKIAASKNPIFRRVYHKTIQKGALVTFNYLTWKHDPYPLVLCTGIYQDGKVAGVNLHYLTFKYVRYLIQQYCGKEFSYPLIKNNSYIYNAFRSYKRDGIRMSKVLDCEFLMNLLGIVRSFRPNEIEAIRQEIQRQLRAKMNLSADELRDLTNEMTSTIAANPHEARYTQVQDYQPLERFGEPTWPNAVPQLPGPKPTVDDARRNPAGL